MTFVVFERVPWEVGDLGKPPWRWKYGVGPTFTKAKIACQQSNYSLPPHHAAEMVTRDVHGYSLHAWNNHDLPPEELAAIRTTWASVAAQMQSYHIGIVKR